MSTRANECGICGTDHSSYDPCPPTVDGTILQVGDRVYWTDPDGGSCSAWGKVIQIQSEEEVYLVSEAGSEIGAHPQELSRRRPRRGK